MKQLKTFLIPLALFGVGTISSSANIKLFSVDLDFELSGTKILTATLNSDIQLRFTEDVVADFVLVLQNAFDPVPSGGSIGETTPFSYERNGDEVLPTASAVEMGYLANPLKAIEPGDFFFEIGEVAFSDGDSFSIVGSAQSKQAWTGDVPTGSSSYNAFLADTNGDPISGVAAIPEYKSIGLFLGIGVLAVVGLRRDRTGHMKIP